MGIDRAALRSGRSSSKKSKRPLESVDGRYGALPHSVLDSENFLTCSPLAKALLLELIRQHNGSNNGHLRLSRAWLKPRGWCAASITRARDELEHYQLIRMTRLGGRHAPHLYALTWHRITDFRNLDISERSYHPGAYLLAVHSAFIVPAKKRAEAQAAEASVSN